MNIKSLLIIISWLCISTMTHAEGGCPPGMIPYNGTDISSCGPVPPGYYQGNQGQQAPPMRWADRWGAVALDAKGTGNIGASHDKASRSEAEEIAMENCATDDAKDCELISTYTNGCVAVAEGSGKFAVASRSDIHGAEEAAITLCGGGKTCNVVYSNCSQAVRIQ